MRRFRLAALLLILTLSSARAEAPKRAHDITVDDYFTLDVLTAQQISKGGKHVAYTLARWDKDSDGRRTDLWVVSCDTKKTRRLTFDHAGVASPRWDEDGKTVYFLGRLKREGEKKPPLDGTAQVWRVGVAGGEPLAVTRVSGGVAAFDLTGALFYQVDVDKTDDDFAALKRQFKVDYGHGSRKASQVWKLDLESWRATKVVDEGRFIREFRADESGRQLAMITAPDETVLTSEGKSRVDVADLGSGKVVALPDRPFRAEAPSPYGWLEHLAWAPDGSRLAFNVIFDGYPAEIIVAEKNGGWKSRRMPRNGFHVRGYGSPLVWTAPGTLRFLAESKGRVEMCAWGDQADSNAPFDGEAVVESLSAGQDGKVALVMNDRGQTPNLFLDEGKAWQRLTNLNPLVDTWKLPKISTFAWKAKDGTPVEGILELPPDYKEGQKVPLVVCIHGGPTTADRLHLQYWIYGRTLLPARGYAVLCPNYRGSTGYGDKFLTDLVGRENDVEVGDILAGVDALVEKGIADPERLGVMGWSNGGYLTNCLITKTTRFKAASSGAGIVDTVLEWGTNDEPAYAIAFKKGLPWDQADLYRKTSPTYDLGKIRTPTLIHVGGNDERCPPGHSRMLYRALREYVKVPTELLVYPGEAHGLMKYGHRKAKMEWDLAWFDRHILGKK